MGIRKFFSGIFAIALMLVLFAQGFYYCMRSLKNGIEDSKTAEVKTSAVAVVYEAETTAAAENEAEAETVVRQDIGCTDEVVCTTIFGWDGHTMEPWEFDLFSRVFYLEFFGSSDVLCEAGCDAILRLWESEEFGPTMGGLLTAVNVAGQYVYDVYAYVWDWQYDEDGLEWCRQLCMKRFTDGPTWYATYFQKWGYPDWGPWSPIPCYEIDEVYFSISRWRV